MLEKEESYRGDPGALCQHFSGYPRLPKVRLLELEALKERERIFGLFTFHHWLPTLIYARLGTSAGETFERRPGKRNALMKNWWS